jgi:LEA14-like dessication related protein
MKKSLPACLLTALLLCLTCKSPPEAPPPLPEESPVSALVFDRIKADSINHIVLYYRFSVENPRSRPVEIEIRGWEGLLNGIAADSGGAALNLEGLGAQGVRISAGAGEAVEKTLELDMDLSEMPAIFGVMGDDEYLARLTLNLNYRYASDGVLRDTISADAAFPRIREPQFTITSIAIMQAELINTRFRVSLRIDNPNIFPLALSSLGYELYGEGRFWADGQEQDVFYIPAQGSSETSLFLMMNFINMKRQLLDDVIAMRLVRYRFTGEVEVGTGVSWLPSFHMGFDRRGNSVVLK